MKKLIPSIVTALLFFVSTQILAAEKKREHKKDVLQKVTLTNQIVDGKKAWIPAELKVRRGKKVELTLVNTLAEPHGFTIPGMTEEIVVGANETKVVTFDPKETGLHPFKCHLHPAHVGGNVVIQ